MCYDPATLPSRREPHTRFYRGEACLIHTEQHIGAATHTHMTLPMSLRLGALGWRVTRYSADAV